MKEKVLIKRLYISKLVWFKKSLLVLDIDHHTIILLNFFVIESVPYAVLSLTDYLKQKSIIHKP